MTWRGVGKTKFLLKPQFESFCPHCVSSGEPGGLCPIHHQFSTFYPEYFRERIKTGNFVKAFNKPHKKYQVCKSCRDCLDGDKWEGEVWEFIVY